MQMVHEYSLLSCLQFSYHFERDKMVPVVDLLPSFSLTFEQILISFCCLQQRKWISVMVNILNLPLHVKFHIF